MMTCACTYLSRKIFKMYFIDKNNNVINNSFSETVVLIMFYNQFITGLTGGMFCFKFIWWLLCVLTSSCSQTSERRGYLNAEQLLTCHWNGFSCKR